MHQFLGHFSDLCFWKISNKVPSSLKQVSIVEYEAFCLKKSHKKPHILVQILDLNMRLFVRFMCLHNLKKSLIFGCNNLHRNMRLFVAKKSEKKPHILGQTPAPEYEAFCEIYFLGNLKKSLIFRCMNQHLNMRLFVAKNVKNSLIFRCRHLHRNMRLFFRLWYSLGCHCLELLIL